jgi:hypothetical protein
VENREGPFDKLRVDILRRMSNFRANMAYSLALFITIQQYCIVLGRFCGERVTGMVKSVGKGKSKPAPSKTARMRHPKPF